MEISQNFVAFSEYMNFIFKKLCMSWSAQKETFLKNQYRPKNADTQNSLFLSKRQFLVDWKTHTFLRKSEGFVVSALDISDLTNNTCWTYQDIFISKRQMTAVLT